LTEQAEKVLRSIQPKKPKKEDYVFLPQKDKISQKVLDIPCNHFKRSFGTARKNAGLDDLHLHDLRHTAASHLLMAGVDIRTLAEILGHKTMQMVQRYTHLLNDHKLKAVDRINGLGME
jgi:site-specific recombinase XerD